MPAADAVGPDEYDSNTLVDKRGIYFAAAAAGTDHVDAAGIASFAAASCTVGIAAAEAVAAGIDRRFGNPDDRYCIEYRRMCDSDPTIAVAEPDAVGF